MHCCPRCFTDRFIQPLIERNRNDHGECPFCGSKDVPLYPARRLGDEFEPLIALYVQTSPESGQSLPDLIQSNWKIFSHNNYSSLLSEIVSDLGVDLECKYTIPIHKDPSLIEEWDTFAEELKHHNRYFPSARPEEGDMLQFLLGNLVSSVSRNTVVYRARINPESTSFAPPELAKPPRNVAGAGRANPEGIPYFYTSSASYTALAEVRPQPGDKVTVAEFEAQHDLQLVDLRDPYRTFTPFGHEGRLEDILIKGLPLLKHLGDELSKPIQNAKLSTLAYLPSQYLCEFIKHNGHDGVIYNSALTQGFNYATFDDAPFAYKQCEELFVGSVDIRTR